MASAGAARLSEDDIRWLARMNRVVHARHIARLAREQEQEREHRPHYDEKKDLPMPRFDGALLRACRTDLKLSRKQLADLADVPFYILSKFEKGDVRPSVATLEKLCRALGVDPNALFSGEADDDADVRPTDLGDATDKWIRDTLASAPPMTERQAARISAILWQRAF